MGLSSSKTKTKSQSQSTTTPQVPSWISGPTQTIAGRIATLAGQTPNPTPASALQTQAFTGAANLTNPSNPPTQTMQSLLNYTPQTVTPQNMGDILASGGLDKYMNPWLGDVERYGLDAIERSRQGGINQNSSDATLSGGLAAYGGSRAGVSDSLTNEAAQRNAGDFSAGIRSAGYDRATGLLSGDIGNNLTSQQFNSSQGLAGAGLNLAAANQADNSARANVGLQGELGAQQHAIDQANNPQNAQTTWLSNLLQLLQGTNPSLYTGQHTDASGQSTTTSTPSLLDSLGSILQMGASAFGGMPKI